MNLQQKKKWRNIWETFTPYLLSHWIQPIALKFQTSKCILFSEYLSIWIFKLDLSSKRGNKGLPNGVNLSLIFARFPSSHNLRPQKSICLSRQDKQYISFWISKACFLGQGWRNREKKGKRGNYFCSEIILLQNTLYYNLPSRNF